MLLRRVPSLPLWLISLLSDCTPEGHRDGVASGQGARIKLESSQNSYPAEFQ
jgi:hypothetical protein